MTRDSPLQLAAEGDLRVPVGVAKWPFFVLGPGMPEAIFEGRQRGRRAYVHLAAKDKKIGLATVADIDVVAWATSAYTKALNSGGTLPATLNLYPADFLRFCRRPAGGRQHLLLAASLKRLANTVVSTNFSVDGSLRPFDWIEAMEWPSSGRRFYEIVFGGWLQEAVEQRQIIKVAPDLLRFRGLQRRLYLWSSAYTSKSAYTRYTLQLADAYRRSGSNTPIRKFIYELRGAVEMQNFPGFTLSIEQSDDGEHLVIVRTAEALIDADIRDATPSQAGELIVPPEFLAVEEPPTSTTALALGLAEPFRAFMSPQTLSLPSPTDPDGQAPTPSDPAALSPGFMQTATPAEPQQRSVNTPLAIGRTRRITYF